MGLNIKNKFICVLVSLSFLTCFSGCSPSLDQNPISISGFKLNTVVNITIYDSKDQSLLEDCLALCDNYDLLFSRTNPNSELYQINQGQRSELSPEILSVLEKGLFYSKLSDGTFDISLAPLTNLWDFHAQPPVLPKESTIKQALQSVGYQNIQLREHQIVFLKEGMGLDFGAIAKGYIADRMKDYLIANGVKSAMINLGGNVLCIGNKPDGEPFKIGIQKPFADRNETIATMDITDKSVVSSGIYERFFEIDGKQYHHILNPKTGYPYENGLISVTIVSDESVDGDALSTSCFSLGLNKGMELINTIPNADAVFITDDYKIHYSPGFEEKYGVSTAP